MRNQCLVVLVSAVLFFGLSAAQDEARSPEILEQIFHSLEALSQRLLKLEDMASYQLQLNMSQQLQELSEHVVAMDRFKTSPKSIMCSAEELKDLLENYKDECADGSHNCSPQASCQDSFDGFICNCNSGYSGDGVTCQDVNECSSDLHNCDDSARCINLDGSYACECVPPLVGDGHMCEEPSCKYPAQEVKGLGCILPVNKPMSFDKARKNCEKEGGRLLEGITNTEELRTIDYVFEDFFYYDRPGHHDIWIGLRNSRWLIEGTEPNRRFWVSHLDSFSPYRKCTVVSLQFNPPGYWDAGSCEDGLPSFCQMTLS